MPTTLVRDLLGQVSTQLHDMAPQFTRWTERELVAWLNDAQRAVAKYLPQACSRVDSVRLRAGTRQSIEQIAQGDIIPGDGSSAVAVSGLALLDVRRTMGSNGATPGKVVRLVDMEILDSIYPDWHTKTGTPNQYAFKAATPKVFYVSPGASGSEWVELAFIALPTNISASGGYALDGGSTVTISVSDTYTDDLINYVLARAYMKDAEFAANAGLAASHTALFTSSINAQATALTGVNPNLQSLPFNPNMPKRG